MNLLKEFLVILIIGALSSMFPLGVYGLMFGLPSYLLNAVLLTFIYRKKLNMEVIK